MEQKKLKKLVLKKEIVSRLENEQMNKMRGGATPDCLRTMLYSCQSMCPDCDPTIYVGTCEDYGGGTDSCASCEPVASCVPMKCPGDNSAITVCPSLVVGGCETRYC